MESIIQLPSVNGGNELFIDKDHYKREPIISSEIVSPINSDQKNIHMSTTLNVRYDKKPVSSLIKIDHRPNNVIKQAVILKTINKTGVKNSNHHGLLNDDMGELDIIDTRKFMQKTMDSKEDIIIEDLPSSITGSYDQDYNIIHVDEIIRKKLCQEKYDHLTSLKVKYKDLQQLSSKPQTYVMREKTLETMKKINNEIKQIETGEKLKIYNDQVKDIITQYRKYTGRVKTIIFNLDDDDHYEEMDAELRHRIYLIDKYLDIAAKYIRIDVIRINNRPTDICAGCGISLAKVGPSDEGTIRCPDLDCQTEHNMTILTKLSKDGSRLNINNSTDDESIENFIKAFIRYQGLQPDQPDDILYDELDDYFERHDRPLGDEIKQLPLNSRGRRGDTDHQMLWNALSQIGRSEYYEDANLIGNIYWGWELHNVMEYKEIIINHYNKTQKVFYEIPPEERCRNSSLGTQYRLWRHLQLVGHECYMDEFKIASNSDSIKLHNKLWFLMCQGCNDPDIYYMP